MTVWRACGMSPIETYGRIVLEAEETLWRVVHAAARMGKEMSASRVLQM